MEQVRPASAQAHAPQKAQAAAGAAHGKPSAAEAPASGAKDGFSLLLAALGGSVVLAGEAQGDGLPESAMDPSESTVGQPETEPAAAGTPLLASGAQDASQQLPQPQMGPAPALQQSGTAADPAKATPGPAGDLPAPLPLAEHLHMLLNQAQHALAGKGPSPDSMVAETARSDAAVRPLVGALRSSHGATGALARLSGQSPGAVAAAAGGGDGSTSQGFTAGAHGMALGADDAGTLAVSGKEPLPTSGSGHAAGDPRVLLREGGALGQWAGDTLAHRAASAMPAAVDAALAARPARTASEGNAQAGTQGGAGGEAGLQQAPVQQGGVAGDGSALAGQDGQLPSNFLEKLGEQVAFWVHQKSQRAEFTLDQAGQPVQVQVTLAGDTAKVAFLSDHASVRQALDANMEDLRGMLQEQGLALADVNVGVAGGRGEGAAGDGQAGHQGSRRGEAQVSVPNAQAGAARRSDGQRALDIFV